MLINLASLNKKKYISFCHFIYNFRVSNKIVFFSMFQHPPRNIHSTGPTNVHPCTHKVYIDAKPGGVTMHSYYFNSQSSFIKVERLGSPETSRCLLTNLHGVRPTIQQN